MKRYFNWEREILCDFFGMIASYFNVHACITQFVDGVTYA